MKKIFSLLIIFCILTIFSCGSDSDEDTIVGKWEITSFQTTGCDDSSDDLSFDFRDGNCFEDSGVEFCIDIEFEFKENGSMTQKVTTIVLGTQNSETTEYNYSLEGNSLRVCETASDCSTEEFILSGNTLTFGFTDSDNCEITITASRI